MLVFYNKNFEISWSGICMGHVPFKTKHRDGQLAKDTIDSVLTFKIA